MSDFIIVFAVAVLGLLAQAAGGKRVKRLVTVPTSPVARTNPAAHEDIQGSADSVSDSAAAAVNKLAEVKSASSAEGEIKSEISQQIKSESESEVTAEEVKSEFEPEVKAEVSESEPVVKAEVSESEPVVKAEVSESEPVVKAEEVKPESEPEAKSEEVKSESDSEITNMAPASGLAAAAISAPPVVREEFYMTRKPGIEYFLRVTIFLWFIGLALYYYISNSGLAPPELLTPDPWVMQVTFVTCALTGLGLVKGFRTLLSYFLSAIDCIFDIKLLKAAKNWNALKPAFAADRVFVPASIPHMVGLFIYVQTMFYLLAAMSPKTDFQMPGMPLPMPLPLDQLFSYNGLGLVMLAFCGCGILVTRQFKEVMQRLALVRPTPPQIMLGLGLVFMSFMYDYVWSLYTHSQHLGLDMKLEGYNGGTFTAAGGFTGALVLALATAVFAGVGEETLIRGALQPVFGLVPAAILHGVLHAQFQHAPIFIVQVAGWSILMGIAKRYTNTTTTIIGHAGFNFVTSFLFAFNPPDL